jgi:Flp pilus assembly protein TadB
MSEQQTTDVITAVAAKWVALGAGAASAVIGWLGTSQAAFLIGSLVAIATLVSTLFFSRRRDKREQQRFDVSMKARLDGADD